MSFNYYAMHFHMKSGGVKIVIENLLRALSSFSDMQPNLIESGKQADYIVQQGINHIKINDIDYDDTHFDSYEELEKKASEVMIKIKKSLDFSQKCIIHVHNINVFKNSYVGLALKLLADKHKDNLLILFQVHDFAEDSRADRMELMNNCTGKKDQRLGAKLAYPLTKNSIYMTINSRDKRLLKHISIPSDRVFVFPNAVNTQSFKQKPLKEERLLNLIGDYAKKEKYIFSKERKILLYPVKVIRRKNIVEAILLLKLLNFIKDKYQLLITLDASTELDVKYSKKIKDYIRKNKLPVVIGFGFEVISPNEKRAKNNNEDIICYTMADLFYYSDCILSTSKLEGFGFAFVEGWLADKQVVGRRINFIMEDFEDKGIRFPGFYDKIIVDGKDFKNFTLKEQFNLLDNLNFNDLLNQEDIKNFINNVNKPDNSVINFNKSIIEKEYSLKGYVRNLNRIVSAAIKLSKNDISPEINNSFLIDYFSTDKIKTIIITDMDATFLDHENYSYKNSLTAYKRAVSKDIPVCFCTSKSFPEIEHFALELGQKHPFIAENGAVVYVPKNYFSFDIRKAKFDRDYEIKGIKEHKGYYAIELNVNQEKTYAALKKMKQNLPFEIIIYTDQTENDMKNFMKFPNKEMADRSMEKYYANGARIPNMTDDKLKQYVELAEKYGFTAKQGGRFIGINKGSDKGKATDILIDLFRKEFKKLKIVGLGDSPNDFSMLKRVDHAFIVLRPDGHHIKAKDLDVTYTEGIGPKGWSIAVNKILDRL